MYDNIGTARGLVDASGTVTDTYELDTFGRSVSSSGTTPNPYRFGAAWGYITDPSGFLQLGARYYWPEVGRFISQDPIGEGGNWYGYVSNRPTTEIDPAGLMGYWACVDKCLDTLLGGTLVPIVTTINYWATVWVEKQVKVYVCTPSGGKWVTQIIKMPVRILVTRQVISWVALGTGAFAGGITVGCVAQCAIPAYRDFWETY